MVWPCKQNASEKIPPKQALLAKANERDRLDDLELDGPIELRILDGIAWYFTQAK